MLNQTRLLRLFPAAAALLFFIMIFIFVVIISFQPAQKKNPTTLAPTITPINQVTPAPRVIYDKTSSDKMLSLLKNRQQLASNDQQIKQALIQTATSNNDMVYKTSAFSIEYISSSDEFLTEINSPQISQTKQEVTDWLTNQGLSTDGICHLPLVFYLGGEARIQINKDQAAFNPIPDYCK